MSALGGGGGTLGPLPAGRHGFSREQVAHNQRERLIAGLADRGRREGLPRGDDHRHHQAGTGLAGASSTRTSRARSECFLAAFEVVVGHIRELADEAVAGVDDWPERAIAAARAVLAFFAEEPDLARLCLVESQAAGPAVAARFHEAVHEVVPLPGAGRAERPSARELPATTEESTIGALVMLASRKVAAGEAEQLEDLLPDVAEFILAPTSAPRKPAALLASKRCELREDQ